MLSADAVREQHACRVPGLPFAGMLRMIPEEFQASGHEHERRDQP